MAVLLACILRARKPRPGNANRTVAVISHARDVPTRLASRPGILVDVSGRVRRPGVYSLPSGSRVLDAIERAGGLRADANLATLNRAAKVVDGQQIIVAPRQVRQLAGPSPSAAADGGVGSSGPVSINAADVAALDTLQGIGPITAQHIIDDRNHNGPFASIDDLDRVPGIGAATIDSIRTQVTL